jgi:hypothetical protein
MYFHKRLRASRFDERDMARWCMSPAGTESEAAAGGEMLKRKGSTTDAATPASGTWPIAVRQISLPSTAGVEYHSCLRKEMAPAGSARMAAR